MIKLAQPNRPILFADGPKCEMLHFVSRNRIAGEKQRPNLVILDTK
jgi:hypothetical protein